MKQKSFFQTTAGVATGLAGVLTGIVGLLTVSVQLGWLGSKNNNNPATTNTTATTAFGDSPTTVFGSPTTSARTGTTSSGSATATPQFTVDPTSITFENLGPRDQEVTIRNTGTVAVSFQTPKIAGVDVNAFTVTDLTCGGRLDLGRSCQLRVTFTPPRGGSYNATLVIQPLPVGVPAKEVPLKGTSLL